MNLDASADEDRSEKVIDEPDGHDAPHQETDCCRCLSSKEQKKDGGEEDDGCPNTWDECSDGGHAAPERWAWHSEDREADAGHDALDDRDNQCAADDRIDRGFEATEDVFIVRIR